MHCMHYQYAYLWTALSAIQAQLHLEVWKIYRPKWKSWWFPRVILHLFQINVDFLNCISHRQFRHLCALHVFSCYISAINHICTCHNLEKVVVSEGDFMSALD
ncbi:hypothetical protein CDL12_13372 [Handroanthus impetiginosus]|uniref:Uncharacterized protein n=1 Tax=Handroanthus impetiginosus TaxID=429701 RepID=A0A2G9H916_9LAMI|nr:hypothetical protein CDL12_13372 [Handroanthus impetiginosus]